MSSMEPKVIFEDEEILVLDKPAGLIVNRSDTTVGEKTVQEWVDGYVKVPRVVRVSRVPQGDSSVSPRDTRGTLDTRDTYIERSGIVHRLDKETSGILLTAKTKEAFENLQKQFKERKVKKTYIALVHGKIESSEGEINVPVGRLPWNRKRFGVLTGGREAVTKYKILRYYDTKNLLEKNMSLRGEERPLACHREQSEAISMTARGRLRNPQNSEIASLISFARNDKNTERLTLVELYPKTGRTHQIRVHLKYFGHPIFADALYGGRKTARNDRKLLSRIFLHAAKISFFHPKSGRLVSFESPLPKELSEFLTILNS